MAPSRAQVAVISEEHDDLAAAIKSARAQLPGLFPDTLPRLVLIKPNLCDVTSWETGVTTDPRWIGVLADELRSFRADVRICVVESDAVSAYKTHRSCDETFERLGYAAAAKSAGVELVNLSRCETIEIQAGTVPIPIRIPDLFMQEMFFVSVANLKVHPYARMTGILKNSIGLVSDADISAYHPHLSALISTLHRLCPPDLCIIDGRIGLEGQGPIIGRPVRMNTILVGNDALAVDETSCRIMGISPQDVPHLRRTARDLGRSLGAFDISGQIVTRPFAFDAMEAHKSIQVKFGIRRFYHRIERGTGLWVDRAMRFRREPAAFMRNALAKLTGGRRAQ